MSSMLDNQTLDTTTTTTTTTKMVCKMSASIDFDPNYFELMPSLAPIDSWTDLVARLLLQPSHLNSVNILNFFYHNYHVCYYIGALYLALVYLGHQAMKTRAPFNLRLPLAAWSFGLAAFSIAGTLAVWPEFVQLWRRDGFVATYTKASYHQHEHLVRWYTLFTLSKVPELVDTFFVVARKQKLIPLHWIHHVLTMVFTFFVYVDGGATPRWMVSMNLLVHSLMYSYYCLKALRVHVPRTISVLITTLQIIQMFFGLYIHAHVLVLLGRDGRRCHNTYRSAVPGLAMYLLYFYFFVQFFIDNYFKAKPKKQQQHHHQQQPSPSSSSRLQPRACIADKYDAALVAGDINNNANLCLKKAN